MRVLNKKDKEGKGKERKENLVNSEHSTQRKYEKDILRQINTAENNY